MGTTEPPPPGPEPGPGPGTVRFEPRTKIIAGYAVGAAALLVTAAVLGDAAGRLLLGIGAAVLWVQAARGWIGRPTVEVTDVGLRLARGMGHEFAAWEHVGSVKSGESRRLVPTQWLEIDLHDGGEDRLVTVPGWRLGVPVSEVAAAIEAARPAAPEAVIR